MKGNIAVLVFVDDHYIASAVTCIRYHVLILTGPYRIYDTCLAHVFYLLSYADVNFSLCSINSVLFSIINL